MRSRMYTNPFSIFNVRVRVRVKVKVRARVKG